MANGKIRFGKQSGGELALVFPDGTTNTEVTFPESGVLATEQYVYDSAVKLTGDQTIEDVKTFTSSPIVPTPTTDFQVATKKYVDDNAETPWIANDTRAKTALNASGTAPIYACRAWVNFNGTGTVAIRASGNVSSITDNGTGDYTVNFITAIIDAKYGLSLGYMSYSPTTIPYWLALKGDISTGATLKTTIQLRVIYAGTGGISADVNEADITIFR